MAQFKLADGTEFEVKAATPDSPDADKLVELAEVDVAKLPDPARAKHVRALIMAALRSGAPEAAKRATLVDVVELSKRLGELLDAVWGGAPLPPEAPADASPEEKAAAKKGDAPEAVSNGSGPES